MAQAYSSMQLDIILTKSKGDLVGKVLVDFLYKINSIGCKPTKTIGQIDYEPN